MSEMNKLLGLDRRIERPNAYQIFGLEVLESDPGKIQNGIKSQIRRLKAAKESADPAIWQAAAKSVNKAQQILSDAEQKAKYDLRLKTTFQSVAVSPTPAPAVAAATGPPDLLSGWLPESDPFAAFDMAAAIDAMSTDIDEDLQEDDLDQSLDEALQTSQEASQIEPIGQPITPLQQESAFELGSSNPFGQATAVAEPIVKPPKKRRRRKKGFPVAGTMMALFVLGLFGGMGYCVKMLMDRENERTQVADAKPNEPKVKVKLEPRRPVDPIMGTLLPETPDGVPPQTDTGIRMGVKPKVDDMINRDRDNESFSSVTPVGQEMTNNPSVPMNPDQAFNTGQISAAMEKTEVVPMDSQPSEEMITAGKVAADAARSAIREGNWDEMMSLAEKALDAAATDEQREQALARRRLVNFASEYQSAIDRSIDKLQATERVELREGLTVGVVEVTPDELILRVSGKNKTYDRKNLVPILAHAFAPRGLPDDENLLVAMKGSWVCLQTGATQAQRDETYVSWLQIAGKSEDANVDGLQEEVEAIFN